MYRSVQEMKAWFERVASSSIRPKIELGSNNVSGGSAAAELYTEADYMNEKRQRNELKQILAAVLSERKLCRNKEDRAELMRLERQIEARLKVAKTLPGRKATYTQCFVAAAELLLNHDIFEAVKIRAHEIYHAPLNRAADVEMAVCANAALSALAAGVVKEGEKL